uniref:Uncharacterized protein n=1 Tax=Triticum urartu TaxID=4572 RepID=A0A8R7P740_TRIUA
MPFMKSKVVIEYFPASMVMAFKNNYEEKNPSERSERKLYDFSNFSFEPEKISMRRLHPPPALTHVRGVCASKGPCYWLSLCGRRLGHDSVRCLNIRFTAIFV